MPTAGESVVTQYRTTVTVLKLFFLSRLVLDHFAPLAMKCCLYLQSARYIKMSICRHGNLVLACDFAENHSPAYVTKSLSNQGVGFRPGGFCQGGIMSWIHGSVAD